MEEDNKISYDNKLKNIPIKKNEEYIVKIIDYGTNGEGIAKIDGYTIFVIGAMSGERCKIHITKILSSQAYAKVVEIIDKSDKRVVADCDTYKRCGGCSLRHISYDETLKIKQKKVQNLVNKMLDTKVNVNETIGMENPIYYRNKAIFPINQNKQVGIFAERSHEIIPIEECMIQTKISQEISKYIVENWNNTIYDESTGRGILRNIMIREGFATHEIMVVLVLNNKLVKTEKFHSRRINVEKFDIEKKHSEETDKTINDIINKCDLDIQKLIQKFPMIKTVVANINNENTNVVLSKNNVIIYGEGYIIDKLGDCVFKISPNSFYQVNPVQTQKIYDLAIKEAGLNNSDIICDLYCGIGTIGIFASKYVNKVYGVEIVEAAVNDAKENAKLNKISNIEFYIGDVEKVFSKMIQALGKSENKQSKLDIDNENKRDGIIKNATIEKPNVIFVDPPRKGLDDNTVKNLCDLQLEKIIYISCNPATLMRDLHKLEKVYSIEQITPIDNFPYSSHIECVVKLVLKNN